MQTTDGPQLFRFTADDAASSHFKDTPVVMRPTCGGVDPVQQLQTVRGNFLQLLEDHFRARFPNVEVLEAMQVGL